MDLALPTGSAEMFRAPASRPVLAGPLVLGVGTGTRRCSTSTRKSSLGTGHSAVFLFPASFSCRLFVSSFTSLLKLGFDVHFYLVLSNENSWSGKRAMQLFRVILGAHSKDCVYIQTLFTSIRANRCLTQVTSFQVTRVTGNGNPLQYSCLENPVYRGA